MSDTSPENDPTSLHRLIADQGYQIAILQRQVDELLIAQRLSDIAHVDMVRFTGPPKTVEPNPTAQDAGNSLVIHCHTFVPRNLNPARKHPLIVLAHGGVHGRHNADAVTIVRELVEQGYSVVAPDYRGSDGYGRPFWEAIDYGGREVDDCQAAREWALDTWDHIDPKQLGIIGWSHGGLITLFSIFDHADDYAVAYAAVPVSDLVARMGYKGDRYRAMFSAPYHIGKTAEEDVAEYRRRSPSWQVDRYQGTPLLIHSSTNDEDVNVLEVERLIQAFAANGASVQSRIYDAAPGSHVFNRIDSRLARESRHDVWRFLAGYLHPDRPVN